MHTWSGSMRSTTDLHAFLHVDAEGARRLPNRLTDDGSKGETGVAAGGRAFGAERRVRH